MLLLTESKIKESETFRVFDSISSKTEFVIAYSGGKDSTLTAILFYRWLKERGIKGKKVTLIHNDTQSELDVLEFWARSFMREICRRINETGNKCEIKFTVPEENFYFNTIVLGYPAPSFTFRWCVKHLKVKPNNAALNEIKNSFALITGHRQDESHARAASIKHNACALSMSCNSTFFQEVDLENGIKALPIINWSLADVWAYLGSVSDFDLSGLFGLYGNNMEARYGCWHCTLVKIQRNIYNLPQKYLYLEALRIIYRAVSDLPELRMKKDYGYSRLGPLNEKGRAILLKLFLATEKLSGLRLYGLDEFKIEGHTLRELFYFDDAAVADKIILNKIRSMRIQFSNRIISIERIRNAKIEAQVLANLEKAIEANNASLLIKLKSSAAHTEDPLHKLISVL